MCNQEVVKICGTNIFSKFIKLFIDEKSYLYYAKKYKRTTIYAADFLIEPRRETFEHICEEISKKESDFFNIIICLSTIYDNGYNDNFECERLSKKELIKILEIQEKDMCGEELLYVKNVEFIKYWDIMIFDDTYSWTCVLTHEDDVDGSRLCFSQEIGNQSGDGSMIVG